MNDEFIERLEHELVAASRRRARLRMARMPYPAVRAPRSTRRVLGPAAAIAVCAAVLIAALVLLRPAPNPHPTAPARRPAGLHLDSATPLSSVLGVLRRRQSAADSMGNRIVSAGALRSIKAGWQVRSQTRLLARLPGAVRLFLFVTMAPRTAGAPPGRATVGNSRVCLAAVARSAAADPGRAPQTYDAFGCQRASTLARPSDRLDYFALEGDYGAQLVPDGVASARWVFGATQDGRRITLLPTIANNVAYRHLVPAEPQLLSISWHLAGGGVLLYHPSFRVPSPILSAHGIGSLRFGARPARVRRLAQPSLGRPLRPYQRTSACRVDHVIGWAGLIAFFSHGRFVGYSYGTGRAGWRPPAGQPMLATAHGLVIGDSVARARRLYGRAFHLSAEQGGSWWAMTPRGRIEGYTSGVRSGSITTIEAGDVGCPAMTP
jgi:hypothetical protein